MSKRAERRLNESPAAKLQKSWEPDPALVRMRRRTAAIVLLAITVLLGVLASQHWEHQKKVAPGPVDYLASLGESKTDPLRLDTDALQLIGVSHDGRVVGYGTDLGCDDTVRAFDAAMKAQGWAAVGGDEQGLLTYARLEADVSGGANSALVIFAQQGEGCSVVVELM